MVWASNAGGAPADFSLSLNATQLGLRNQWVILGLNDSTITTGSGGGQPPSIQKQIPANSWYPLIIGAYNGSFVASYSDATIQRQLQYPNQGLYSTGASGNQSVVLVISSASPVGSVSLNSNANLTSVPASSFYSSHEGWYYDNNSHILLVKFQSSGDDTLRVLSASPAAVRAPSAPTTIIGAALAVLLVVDVAVFLYLVIAGHRGASRTPRAEARAGRSSVRLSYLFGGSARL